MSTVIYRVDDVALTIQKTNPPHLVIHALGTVSSGGWSNGRLVPYVYIQFPPDGIWDFTFVADAPIDQSIQVLLPIAASYVWNEFSPKLLGVRIHASSNNKVQMISKSATGTWTP